LLAELRASPTPRPLRALVRREFDAVRLREQGIEAVTGDLIERHGLDAAMRGVTTLVYLVHTLDRDGDVVANELEAVQNALIAARAAGVRRVIMLGSVGASERSVSSALLAQWAVELAVRQSGLHWVIVRTPFIVGAGSTPFELMRRIVNRSPVVPLFRWRRTEVEPVAIADVTEALRLAIDEPEYDGRAFDMCGADRTTFGHLVREWGRVSGRRRLYIPLPGWGEGVSSQLAWTLARLPRRETTLQLGALRERQVCPDPSRRFPLPHRPLGLRAALAAVIEGERQAG
jgi:uncharacterized protein YbjT (DUF2867 family)